MSDLSISATALGTGAMLGAMGGYAAKSTPVGFATAAIGIAAGGLAAYAVDRGERTSPGDGSVPGFLHPHNALGALGGAGLGVALTALVTSTVAFQSGPAMARGQTVAMFGAFALGGAVIGSAMLGFLRSDG